MLLFGKRKVYFYVVVQATNKMKYMHKLIFTISQIPSNQSQNLQFQLIIFLSHNLLINILNFSQLLRCQKNVIAIQVFIIMKNRVKTNTYIFLEGEAKNIRFWKVVKDLI
jgi:hypothetical protein